MKEKYKHDFLQAGAIAKEVRAFGKSLITPGASYNTTIKRINEKIFALGARPAFPPQIALNHVAAHFLPFPDEDIVLSDQLIKLDVGVCYNGAIGDCATTVDLSGKYQHIIDAVEAALQAAENVVKVGISVREIGKAIEAAIAAKGLKPIKNLCGHGLGYYKIHTAPQIPNYGDMETKAIIQPGMTFAIEPFATNGKGLIYETGTPTIFSFIGPKFVQSNAARKILPKLKAFSGLPFAMHELMEPEMSIGELSQGLSELLEKRVIAGYPPLVEQENGMVAQAENSVLVDDDGNVTISTR